jgi:hypothetical protein
LSISVIQFPHCENVAHYGSGGNDCELSRTIFRVTIFLPIPDSLKASNPY